MLPGQVAPLQPLTSCLTRAAGAKTNHHLTAHLLHNTYHGLPQSRPPRCRLLQYLDCLYFKKLWSHVSIVVCCILDFVLLQEVKRNWRHIAADTKSFQKRQNIKIATTKFCPSKVPRKGLKKPSVQKISVKNSSKTSQARQNPS